MEVLADIDFYERYCETHKGTKTIGPFVLLQTSAGSMTNG